MKILAYILILLLLGGAAYFYLTIHKPMAEDYARMKAGMPELDRAKGELKKYKERENWIKPVMDALTSGLSSEISAGKAEVAAADGRVVVNIAEQVLYTPDSVTFAKDSPQTLLKIATLLRDLKDREICVGNVTNPAPAQRKGRKKIPARDALDIAADRSVALVKYLVNKGVPKEFLCAAAYPAKQPDRGFGIKEQKTVITISSLPAAGPHTKPAPEAKGPAPAQPKPIPIQPAPTKPR